MMWSRVGWPPVRPEYLLLHAQLDNVVVAMKNQITAGISIYSISVFTVLVAGCGGSGGNGYGVDGGNGSSNDPMPPSVDGDIPMDEPVFPLCDPVIQSGCEPGEKCSYLVESREPFLARTTCVPDGNAQLDGSCQFGEPGPSTGFDDCEELFVVKSNIYQPRHC